MMFQWNFCFVIVVAVFLGYPRGLDGLPTDPAAAVAADPAAASSVPVAAVSPPAAASIAPVEPAIAVDSPVAPAPVLTKAAPLPQQPVGSGVVTEHKNPDGSIITITRFNGPLPANAFPNPLASGLFSQYGLHDNLYQTQPFLQQQNMMFPFQHHLMNNFYPTPAYNYQMYRSPPEYFPNYYSSAGSFLTPYFGFGYPFGYPYGGQPYAAKSIK